MNLGSGLIAAMLAGSVGMTALQAPPSPGPGDVRHDDGASEGGVTLITGDRVVVTGRGHRVEPGPGRQVSYHTRQRGGHLYVFPSDAMPLVAQGVLDERLFDVTQLLQWRYGDADRADIPLISQSAEGVAPAAPQAARQTMRLDTLGMGALRVPKADTAKTWKDLVNGPRALAAGKSRLWLDGRREFTLDRSVSQIGAPEAWKQGMTGEGVTVAVLDSGYDPDHPDLKQVVTQSRNFSDAPDIRDNVGHGTHVASIIAGAGEKYRGVAPGAKIAVGKIGEEGITDSALLAGMEWAAVEVKAKIVNMSLGAPDTPDLDPVEQAVNTLSERTGVLFVVAAGNEGSNRQTISSPGSADAALTVGAVDKSDRMAEFSSRGPRLGDHAIKPDVTAPGVDIMAAAAAGTADGPYVSHDGTSMAAPHVAGAAAILAQRHPDWNGARLKAALVGSATPTADAGPYDQGAGRVDVARAVAQQVAAVSGSISVAFPWRDSGKKEATRTITYANSGDSPVTLDLAADEDMLSLSSARLEVPAKGEASVTVTINAEQKAPGDYAGVVTARSGDTAVRTLAGAYVEPESYDVTVTGTGRNGQPAFGLGEVYSLETGTKYQLFLRDGVAKIRLPVGTWNLYADLFEDSSSTTAHIPVTVGKTDQNVVLDARQAKKIEFAVDEPTAAREPSLQVTLANGSWYFGWSDVDSPRFEHFVLPVRQPGLRYLARTVWHKKDATPSPYRYDLVDYQADGIPDDPSSTARTRDLVKVTATYRASGVAATGSVWTGPRLSGLDWAWESPTHEVGLPGTVTHYRTPGFTWNTEVTTGTSWVRDTGRQLDRGPVRETWNTAVTGPAFATPGGSRTGDELRFPANQLFADGTPGRSGGDGAATGTVTLARGGEVIAKTDLADCDRWESPQCLLSAELPAAKGTYTLHASAGRQVPYAALSTAVDAVWTFHSATAEKPQPLPLMAVRYAPEGLDDLNRAARGSVTRVPIRIERNPGAAEAAVRSVKLEVSSDDGAGWRAVPVIPAGSGWTALLANPGTPGFVSLRATVTDAAGDSVVQTITRAYAVR
ncbi:S8 family serine peptidase [Microtetraspora malaysiensis]|uniref:S8 family serine peptidase n=1 Tax=Microtetraspora malaysiensis TaxID=161358 RepID=A0ABW6SYD1_9ACTN